MGVKKVIVKHSGDPNGGDVNGVLLNGGMLLLICRECQKKWLVQICDVEDLSGVEQPMFEATAISTDEMVMEAAEDFPALF